MLSNESSGRSGTPELEPELDLRSLSSGCRYWRLMIGESGYVDADPDADVLELPEPNADEETFTLEERTSSESGDFFGGCCAADECDERVDEAVDVTLAKLLPDAERT